MTITRLLFDPDRFFAERTGENALHGPFSLVTAAAVASILSPTIIAMRFTGTLPSSQRSIVGIGLVISLVMGFLSIYVGWLAVAVIAYGLASRVFDAPKTDFRTLFRSMGWGFLPSIPAGIISAAAAYDIYYAVEVPSNPQQIDAMTASLSTSPISTISQTLMVVFTLWQGFIWLFGIKHASDLSARRAALVAAVPSAFILVVQVGLG